jgi:putative ABC transport system permease protein
MTDLRYALRTLGRAPGFTAVAVLTMALGIGATAAIFSAVNGVLLRPLPYPDADRITVLWLNNEQEGIERDVTSYPMFEDWSESASYAAVAGHSTTTGTFTGDGDADLHAGAWVTGDFFRVLGVPPALGRALDRTNTVSGENQVVVLSHGLWTRRYGADPLVVGRTVTINGSPLEVVGVMPRGFSYPDGAEYWAPLAPAAEEWATLTESRNALWLSVLGRLHEEVPVERAAAELDGIMARLADEGLTAPGNGVLVEPLRDTVVGGVRPALLVLLGAVVFVLLIACANVANLLLARGARRRRELSVRAALGASGRRLARQALVESLVLGAIGGTAGLGLGLLGTSALVALSPQDLPRLDGVRVDGLVVGFAALVALATGLLFGLAPAWQASKSGIAASLRDSSRGSGRGMSRVRPALVMVEVALAVVLLVGAGLLLRSFAALQTVDPGFQTERTLSFRVIVGSAAYPEPERVRNFQQELLERVGALPGVEAVTAANTLFLSRLPNMGAVAIEGRPPAGDLDPITAVTNDFVAPGFFRTMGMPMVQGRSFEPGDVADGMQVVVVNETFVRRLMPGEEPIGRRFTRGNPENPDAVWQTIVGVVADSRRAGLAEPIRPEAYRPITQVAPRSIEVLVRTAGPPLDVAPQARALLRELDPNMPMAQLRTVEAAMAEAVATRRFVMMLLAGFAALAVALAAIGIYGVLAFLVGERTRELGIRFALGADRRTVIGMVLRQSLRYVLPGLALGALGALALTRLLQAQLFGVEPTDPVTFGAVLTLLLAVALLASWVPARRAASVQPVEALRQE